MKEFEKWLEALDSIQVANKFNNQNRAIAGCAWKAALEWVLKNRKPYYNVEDKKVVATDSDILYKELKES